MCVSTPSISLPLLPVSILSLSILFIVSRLISRPLANHLCRLARAHVTWVPGSPFDRSDAEPLDRFMRAIVKELRVRRYRHRSEQGERVRCVFCLCLIEEGEEIREIRCDHLFHKVCLDRWLGYRHATCPLCRGSLVPLKFAAKLKEMEDRDDETTLSLSFLYARVQRAWWLR